MNRKLSKKELVENSAQSGLPLNSDMRANLTVLIVGTAPLMVNNWSAKGLQILRDRHGKVPETKLEAKDPQQMFEDAKYKTADGHDGVPAHGLKGAFVEGARFIRGNKEMNMTMLKAALRVQADCPATNLLRLYSPTEPVNKEAIVHIGQGKARTVDLRYRPVYWPWFLRVHIQFPSKMFSAAQIGDLIRAAGAFNGFCEWRPGSPQSLTGSYGTFEIGDEAHMAAFEQAFGVPVRRAA